MHADDLILVSVDDHICEPADMFDAHVPDAVPGAGATRGGGGRRVAAVVLRLDPGPEPRSQRGRGQAAGDVQRQPHPVRGHAARLLRRRRAGARHVGRRPARRAQLPELDRLLRPGPERGPRPRRQPRDDPGVQRLARRRVVRRPPRALHPVRDPAAVRRGGGGHRGPPARRRRAATPSRSRRTRPGSACPASTPTTGTRCSRRAATSGPCCAATSGRRRRRRARHRTRRHRCR